MIVGGLHSVTALRENDQERVTVPGRVIIGVGVELLHKDLKRETKRSWGGGGSPPLEGRLAAAVPLNGRMCRLSLLLSILVGRFRR